MNNTIWTRKRLLTCMNDYVLEIIGDDLITNYWLMCGIPDEASDSEIKEIAENDELWEDCVKAFEHCITAETHPDEM